MTRLMVLFMWLPCILHAQEVKQFNNGAIRLFYEETGKGPALYLLTGGPGAPPGHPSKEIMARLKDHYTVVLLHQRGSGRSRNIPVNENTINIKSYLEDIEQLRKTRGDKKVALLGISWGGLLAMNYAAVYPKHVAALVLIGSAPPSYKLWNVLFDNQKLRHSQAELDSMNRLMQIFTKKTDRELDSLKSADPAAEEVRSFKTFIAMHMRAMYFHRERVMKDFDSFFTEFNFQPIPFIDKEVLETKWDITADLKKLKIPALILYGRQDDQGESTFYLQKESLRNSDMHVIEQCGHIMWEDQPDEFYSVLVAWLVRKRRGMKM